MSHMTQVRTLHYRKYGFFFAKFPQLVEFSDSFCPHLPTAVFLQTSVQHSNYL